MSQGTVLRDAMLLMGGYDLTGFTNAISPENSVNELDSTCFGDQTSNFQAGLKKVAFGASGLIDPAALDPQLFSFAGGNDNLPISYANSAAIGSPAYTFQAGGSKYEMSAGVGELLKYDLQAFTRGNLARGVILDNRTGATAGGSTPLDFGAIAAGQTLVFAMHVLQAGTALTFALQRDDNSGFTSPASVYSQSNINAVGSYYFTSQATSSDNWYRINRTVNTGTFRYIAILARI